MIDLKIIIDKWIYIFKCLKDHLHPKNYRLPIKISNIWERK